MPENRTTSKKIVGLRKVFLLCNLAQIYNVTNPTKSETDLILTLTRFLNATWLEENDAC